MFKSLNINSKSGYFILLSGIFICNLILKISFLGAEPFWYDEIVSVKATLIDFGHIKHMSEWDNNPPFYYYCLWVWAKMFGISEFNVRLLSVLFSSVSVCLLFHFLKKHYNILTGLFGALLFSFHGFSYEYSHEARCYSLVVLLVILSTICFFHALEKKTFLSVFWLGLVNFLVIYTHYIAGLILFFQLVLVLIYKRDFIKQFGISIAILLLFVLLRFTKKQFLVMLSFNKEGKTFWLQTADSNSLKEALANLFFGETVWLIFLTVFFISLAATFILRKKNSKDQNLVLVYSVYLSVMCIALTYFIGMFKPIFLARYILFTVPFILILISHFLSNINKLIALLVIPLVCLAIYSANLNPSKPMDFKLASLVVKRLQENKKPMILIQTKDVTALFAYYFDISYFKDYKNLTNNLKNHKVFELENKSDLSGLPFTGENTIIFCQTFEKQDDSNQIFDIFKQNNFVFKTTKGVKGVKISLLRKIEFYEK